MTDVQGISRGVQPVIVTGGNGFLGSWVVRNLANKYPTIALIREESDTWRIDNIKNLSIKKIKVNQWPNFILETKPWAILTLDWAGVSNRERNSKEQVLNVQRHKEIMNAALRIECGVFMNFGSQAEVGPYAGVIPEQKIGKPTTNYGKAKLDCYDQLTQLTSDRSMRFIWARIFSTYGPNDSPDWFLPSLIESLARNDKFQMTAGDQKWNFLHCQDFASAVIKVLENENSQGIINIASSKQVRILDVALLAQSLYGKSELVEPGKISYRTDQVMNLNPSINYLQSIGWHESISLEDGILDLIDFNKSGVSRYLNPQ